MALPIVPGEGEATVECAGEVNDVAIIIDAVPSDGESDSFLFLLLRADGGNCSAVRGLFVFWL